MRIAVAQLTSTTDPDANLTLAADYVRRAKDAGARLVVFPEAMMASFATRAADVAEPLSGPFATRLRELAATVGITIAAGMFTPSDDPDRPRNTVFVAWQGGEASYDKIHLFDVEGFAESDHVTAGDEPVLVDIGGLTFGLAICYDVRFPELFKHYADAGAQVVLVPASWANGPNKRTQWQTLVRARAMDATVYVVGCGQAEPRDPDASRAPLGVGHSLVADPLGAVIAEAGAGPELLIAELDAEAVVRAREKMPVLANTRFGRTPPRPV